MTPFNTGKINNYQFGDLKVSVCGLGLYFGGKSLEANCDKLTPAQMRAANREAWVQKRHAIKMMDRYNNITIYGSHTYEHAFQLHDVAQAVCKATWKRIQTHKGELA